MSKEEIIEEIKRIFLKLTDGEPTPDEEIEARDLLLECFKLLKDANLIPNEINLIDNTINKLENWDTLDLWFKEVDGLTEYIDRFLNLKLETELTQQTKSPSISLEEGQDKLASGIKNTDIDISEVVAQITTQFQGEIDNLKGTIEDLKKELHKKEEKIKDISDETVDQAEITKDTVTQKIPATSLGRLAPPKIKISTIRQPKKSLKVKPSFEKEEELTEQPLDVIDVVSELEESEELKETPKEPTISQITLEELKGMLEQEDETESIVEARGKPKLTPIITEQPSEPNISETPFELNLETLRDKKTEPQEIKLTPLPVNKPEMTLDLNPLPEEEKEFTPLPDKVPEVFQESSIETAEITEIPVKPILTSIPSIGSEPPKEVPKEELKDVEAFESAGKAKFAQLISEKPKISPIKVEEIDTESIQSSSSDLFNVFSTVGHKTAERVIGPSKSIEHEPSKGKKKKSEKKKKSIESPKQVIPIPSKVVESSISELKDIESLPMDKETLYQELIALEGKRYSLEKGYKALSTRYETGKLDDYQFRNQSEGLKINLDDISSRISKIRGLISSL